MLKSATSLMCLALSLGVVNTAHAKLPFEIKNVSPEQVETSEARKVLLLEYRKAAPPRVVFSDHPSGQKCSLNGKFFDCSLGASLALLENTRGKKNFDLAVTLDRSVTHFQIQVLPDDFPSYVFTGKSKLAKDLYFCLTADKAGHGSHLLVLSPIGEIVFYRKLKIAAMDLKPHRLDDGRLFYTYFQIKEGTDRDSRGYRVLMDRDYNVLKTFPTVLDGHEFQLLSENHFLSVVYETKKNELNRCLLDQKVVEYKDGELQFELSALDLIQHGIYYSVGMPLRFFGEPCIGFFHVNSAKLVNKDLLLIGMGLQTFLAYNRTQKKIEWVFGGVSDQFGVPLSGSADMYFSLFHSPVWNADSGSLVLFDNGIVKQSSRVIQFDLDIKNRKINRFETIYSDGIGGSREGPRRECVFDRMGA